MTQQQFVKRQYEEALKGPGLEAQEELRQEAYQQLSDWLEKLEEKYGRRAVNGALKDKAEEVDSR